MSKIMSYPPTLGYWDIRGLAQPIRYLLKLACIPFIDKRYLFSCGTSNAYLDNQWIEDKYSLGLDFPNLPYYIDGAFKLTQSQAILKYLARKYGFIAKDDPTLARQEMIENYLGDIRKKFFGVVIVENYLVQKPAYIKDTLTPQLQQLADYLGSNEWLTPELSYADILTYETLDWIKLFTPETFGGFSTLVQYLNRFETLEPIKDYRNSNEYKDWPLFGPAVKWGFKK